MGVRIVALILCVILAGIGLEVEAQELPHQCASIAAGCDQGTAYSRCMTELSAYIATRTAFQHRNQRCEAQGASSYRSMFEYRSGTGSWLGGGYRNYFYGTRCSARPSYTGTSAPYSTASGYAVPGSITCTNGCTQTWLNNGDGTFTGMYSAASTICTQNELVEKCHLMGSGYFWNAYAGVCQPPVPKCRADQTKDAVTGECKDACPAGMVVDATGACVAEKPECPPGNIKSPAGGCLPGEGQCAAGEVRRQNGTCGKDADGDGVADVDDDDPDNDPKESASGGETCDAPPACNGGAIDCMQVRIQWRIDCNTRRNRNISGGACNAMPVCAGEKCDAMEYAQLLQQWRATCHLEKLANSGSPGGGTGSGSNAMDPVSSDGVLGDDLDPSTVQRGFGGSWNGEGEELAFDESGYGFARTCPTPPTLDVLGKSITFDTSVFCDWMRLGGVFVMIMAYLAGLSIVVRS